MKMINIRLEKSFSIQGDEKQWILCKNDGKRDRNIGYYDDLAVLLTNYIKMCGRTSDSKTLSGLLEYMKSLQDSLIQAIPPYKITIEKEAQTE